MPRVRIEDVAREAGVSTATVDRVLNNRSNVRQGTIARVESAIRRLDYAPDRLAVRLMRRRRYRLRFVVPGGPNSFMAMVRAEIAEEGARRQSEQVIIECEAVDIFRPESLAEALERIGDDIDGAAVVAIDHPAVREAIAGLAARGVAVVTLVSDVVGAQRVRFVGIDNVAAGRTAGSLVGRMVRASEGSVALIAGSLKLRDHAERRLGFEQVIAAEYPHLLVLTPREGHDDYRLVEREVRALLKRRKDLVAIYNVGAGNRGIVAALEEAGRAQEIVAVVHELTPRIRRALVSGTIDAVLNQDAGHEVRSAVRVLLATIDQQSLVEGAERISIDLYLRDNMPS